MKDTWYGSPYEPTSGQIGAIYVMLGLVIFFLIVMMLWIIFPQTFGDDTEDKGTDTLQTQLLERAREWNIQKAMNDTLATAERFNNEYGECVKSESGEYEYCITDHDFYSYKELQNKTFFCEEDDECVFGDKK